MISTKQRAELRKMANSLKPAVIIGKGGLSQTVVDEIALALFNQELVKVSALKNCDSDIKQMAQDSAAQLKADIVQVVGGKFVLYKFSSKDGIEHIM